MFQRKFGEHGSEQLAIWKARLFKDRHPGYDLSWHTRKVIKYIRENIINRADQDSYSVAFLQSFRIFVLTFTVLIRFKIGKLQRN